MKKIGIGKYYTFDTHGGCEELNDRSGSPVLVLRALTEKEVDIPDVGPMYELIFPDGYKRDAFEDELSIELRKEV